MLRSVRRLMIGLPFALAAIAVPALAFAHTSESTGGTGFAEPEVSGFDCPSGSEDSCPRGETLRIEGENLAEARSVVFLGARGEADDRSARATTAGPHRVVVTVPGAARTGPVEVVTPSATADGPRLRVLAAESPSESSTADDGAEGVFPIRGKHEYGTGVNRFGGGRSHQGQDVFAACGTPLVAAISGVVKQATFQSAAGNYLVVDAADGTSQAYMHMLRPATVSEGDRVSAGDRIGQVGQTGRAEGCHLHFEFWTAPGWYEGGRAIDPLSRLKRWDARR